MRCLMMSIKQDWCEKIMSGKKTLELRKSIPHELQPPFKCYIYCTKSGATPNSSATPGKVIGHFICDEIIPVKILENGSIQDYVYKSLGRSFVPYDEIVKYFGKGKHGYAYHISDLTIYGTPLDITEFQTICSGDIKNKCETCKYYYYENTEDGAYEECMLNNIIPVKRPPQSWMYTYEEIPVNDKTIYI